MSPKITQSRHRDHWRLVVKFGNFDSVHIHAEHRRLHGKVWRNLWMRIGQPTNSRKETLGLLLLDPDELRKLTAALAQAQAWLDSFPSVDDSAKPSVFAGCD